MASKKNLRIGTVRIPKFKYDFEEFPVFIIENNIMYLTKVKRMEESKNNISVT